MLFKPKSEEDFANYTLQNKPLLAKFYNILKIATFSSSAEFTTSVFYHLATKTLCNDEIRILIL